MYVIANFKENHTKESFEIYFNEFTKLFTETINSQNVIFCPSFPYLSLVKDKIAALNNCYLGSQSVSEFPEGSHTGEVSSKQLKDFCTYSIVGHSEERALYELSDDSINKKVKNLLLESIIPIVCVSSVAQISSLEKNDKILIAYEPLEYIGSTEAESNENIEKFYESSGLNDGIIYGGSVNYENVTRLMQLPFIKGFLVGSESLNPASFFKLITKIQQLN